MTAKSEVFKCRACGNIIAVLQPGQGELKCCETKMDNVTPNEARRLIHDWTRPGTP